MYSKNLKTVNNLTLRHQFCAVRGVVELSRGNFRNGGHFSTFSPDLWFIICRYSLCNYCCFIMYSFLILYLAVFHGCATGVRSHVYFFCTPYSLSLLLSSSLWCWGREGQVRRSSCWQSGVKVGCSVCKSSAVTITTHATVPSRLPVNCCSITSPHRQALRWEAINYY